MAFIDGYTKKAALQDVLKFLAYRVHHPQAEVTAELLDAEARLQDLNSVELLDAVGAALRCGLSPGIARVGSKVKNPFEGERGRFSLG
jgi:hypothetical protein